MNIFISSTEGKLMVRNALFCVFVVFIVALSGCAASDKGYSGVQYPPSEQVETIFHISQAPASCRVFANLFATIPAKMATREFADRITDEAKSRGADLILIGRSRQCTTESELTYSYYGPDREYRVNEWPGMRFGLEEWGEQGSWAAIGYDEWMRSGVHYDYPIVMQVVFIRCQG